MFRLPQLNRFPVAAPGRNSFVPAAKNARPSFRFLLLLLLLPSASRRQWPSAESNPLKSQIMSRQQHRGGKSPRTKSATLLRIRNFLSCSRGAQLKALFMGRGRFLPIIRSGYRSTLARQTRMRSKFDFSAARFWYHSLRFSSPVLALLHLLSPPHHFLQMSLRISRNTNTTLETLLS